MWKIIKNQFQLAGFAQKFKLGKSNFCSNTVFLTIFWKGNKKLRPKPMFFFAPLKATAWPKPFLQFDLIIDKNMGSDFKKGSTIRYPRIKKECLKIGIEGGR